MAEARQAWERHRETIVLLRRVYDISTAELAHRMNMTRQTMTGRLNGSTPVLPWELPGFARVLGVPDEVLDMGADDALRWVADHPQTVEASGHMVSAA